MGSSKEGYTEGALWQVAINTFSFLHCHLSSLQGGRECFKDRLECHFKLVCSHHERACVCVICWVCEATEAIKKRVIKRLCWLVEISSHTTLIIQSFITFLTSLLVTSPPAQIPLLEGPKVTVSRRSEQKRHSQFFEKPASLKYIFICILFIATNA